MRDTTESPEHKHIARCDDFGARVDIPKHSQVTIDSNRPTRPQMTLNKVRFANHIGAGGSHHLMHIRRAGHLNLDTIYDAQERIGPGDNHIRRHLICDAQ
jgi:hypothetical protein